MEILRGLLFITFLISILRNTIYLLFLWQLKEYRWDRFLVHLKTWQGKRLLLGKMVVAKWLLLLFTPFFLFLNASSLLFLVTFGIFSVEAIFSIKQLLTTGWRLPIFTLKTILIITLVFLLMMINLFSLPFSLSVKILVFDRVLFFLIGLIIVLTNIPASIFKQFIISQAKQKVKNHSDLLVIGITGSYGKSTTKEFLAQILSQQVKVLRTPANINTDIGVAKTILKSLKKEHRFFVCEMGAYKSGEIKAICDIVKPKIGIITGINEQHLSLFGDIRKTIATKFELIEALPPRGLAVFNGENENCLVMANRARAMGREVKIVKQDGVDFETNALDKPFLINFLMAQVVAEKLRIKKEEIRKVSKKLKLPAHTMRIIKKNGLTLIDDTYNSNPQGVLAALDHLKAYQGKKILVFQPIIELGKASRRLHEKVGKKAEKICDLIILTNKNFYQDFLKGAKEKVTLKKDLPQIKKGVILFEGREAENILKFLISNN